MAYANERVNQANNLMASDPDLGPDPGIKAYNEAFARSYENALEEVRDKYLLDNNPIRAIDEAQYKEANGLSDNRTTQELLEDQATFRAQQMEEHLNSHFVEAKHHSLNGSRNSLRLLRIRRLQCLPSPRLNGKKNRHRRCPIDLIIDIETRLVYAHSNYEYFGWSFCRQFPSCN